MKSRFKVFIVATVLACLWESTGQSAPAGEPGPVRLSRESFLAAMGKGCDKQKETDIKEPILYFVEHGFWKVARWGQDLGESHCLEFSISEPHRSVNGYDPLPRWEQDHKMFVRHHDAIFPVLVEGYDVVLRKDGSGATKSAGEKNLYAVMLNQKYNTSDEIGVNCWAETVAAASAESAQQEAMKGLSATERGQTTVASTLALDAIQGYAISVKPKPATSATPPTQKPLGRMSASLVVSRSREPMQSEGTTAPKLYAGCFGLTRDGSAGDGGEDEGVLFLTTADQGKELGKAVLEKGKKQWGQRTGFHAHQTKKIEETQAYTTVSEVKGYTITLEKQENAPKTSPCLYAVVVIQKLEGQWAGQDRWIELVAAADEKEAGSEALNAARTTTSGKTAVEICYRLDAVDGYAVVLHEKR